jgi:hypothetical protein
VTDSSEGTGADNTHTVDNVGRDNYVLFEFNQNVVVDAAFLGYVVGDSDMKVWIGTVPNAFTNHLTLSDAVLASLGFTEVNPTDLTTTRWAEPDAGNVSGNVPVIAADTEDTTPDDRLKINKLTVRPVTVAPTIGVYENEATVTVASVPGLTDSDLSHYTNPAAGTVSGTVYCDDDLDGVRDSGESGVAGVR